MFWFSMTLVVLLTDLPLHAQTCSVVGTAFDIAVNPMESVVRLADRHTRTERFSASDAKAGFVFDNLVPDTSGQRYRIDVLSPPTVVSGSRIPVRSILGIAPGIHLCGRTDRAARRARSG